MNFEQFTHLYPLSKTLRFELRPVGATLAKIKEGGFLENDNHRAESYKKVKKLIDEYHKHFIEQALGDFSLTENETEGSKCLNSYLETYIQLYRSSRIEDAEKKAFEKVQAEMRKFIAKTLKGSEAYKRLFKKELIKEDLPAFLRTHGGTVADEELVAEFKDFTTYFDGFNKNRENMYSEEEKSTAISYRLVNENLPIFVDNMAAFAIIAQMPEVRAMLDVLQKDLGVELDGTTIDELFTLPFFNKVLTQKQIAVYNAVIGSKVIDSHSKKESRIKGINQIVNIYNQQHKDARLPQLTKLKKQILSDREALSWLPEKFDKDADLLKAIHDGYERLTSDGMLEKLRTLLKSIVDYQTEGIFITNKKEFLTRISKKMFGEWNFITEAILCALKKEVPRKRNECDEKYEKRIDKMLKNHGGFSIRFIDDCVAAYVNTLDDEEQKKRFIPTVEAYFATLGAFDTEEEQTINFFSRIQNARVALRGLLDSAYPEGRSLIQDKENGALLKELLDAILALMHFVKPLLGKDEKGKDVNGKDERFYGELMHIWDEFDSFVPLYNMSRNYLTQKPYSEEKYRLFFENNGNVLKGWVDSHTEKSDSGTQYGGYLFRKKNGIGEYDYFLGVSSNKKLFRQQHGVENDSEEECYERLDYYQFKSETLFGSSYVGNNTEDESKYTEDVSKLKKAIESYVHANGVDIAYLFENEETISAYLKRVRKENSDFYENMLKDKDCSSAYNRIKKKILCALSTLKRVDAALQLARKEEYDLIQLFDGIRALPAQSLSFFKVPVAEVEKAMNGNLGEKKSGALFLFQILNKDLKYAEMALNGKRKSRGLENLHTMYFKTVMNGLSSSYDLGSGMIFYRKKTDFHYNESVMEKGHHYNELKDKFSYPIISKRRYMDDKFFFHLSVTLNSEVPKGNENINNHVNSYIVEEDNLHFIGIDRGERHLLYLTVIDSHGHILEQRTLNDVVNNYQGKDYHTDYHDLLKTRERQRQEERSSWKAIENIKDLKEGYLAQVVHQIAQLMVKYHAIVVLEDLNGGFMRERQKKAERSVYQQFEKKLIDKLNYLVDKKTDAHAPGGLMNAYQLANQVESSKNKSSKNKNFKSMGRQSGFIFYIPAWNTSNIDPVTGFTNLFDTRYKNAHDAQQFFSKFESIRYNETADRFEFRFSYSDFTRKAEGSRTDWTVCTYGTRIKTFRDPQKNNDWTSKEVVLTEEFKKFFAAYHVDIHSNLKDSIAAHGEKAFFEQLLALIRLTLQIRNSKSGTDIDYLLSPVADENGVFFDSRSCGNSLPQDADANGAYNIARKGLMLVRQMREAKDLKKFKADMTNHNWLKFAQEKPYLND